MADRSGSDSERDARRLLAAARATPGFMDDDEGVALHLAGRRAARSGLGPLVEVGAYRGRSSLYLAAAIAGCDLSPSRRRPLLYSVDHHHGSEEMQAGWSHHDPSLVDPTTGRMDSLASWRTSVEQAGAGEIVVAVVGDSIAIAADWAAPVSLVLLDGGHGRDVAWGDYTGWSRHVAVGGLLVIHDVFPDPADGGRPPYECYREALTSGNFVEERSASRRSLRVLRRTQSKRQTSTGS